MKFGKRSNIEEVDFTLPDDPDWNAPFLAEAESGDAARLYIGCTGWSMKEWVGTVYPRGTKPADFLMHYARQFNTIELNTTHYRIPNAKQIRTWRDRTPVDFRFCPKMPQVISHSRQLGVGQEALGRFCHALDQLGDRLGCCFMQLPPYFGYDRRQTLEGFLRSWPDHLPLAVELRHESWFDHPQRTRAMAELLATYGCATVITDVAGRRDVLHQYLTDTQVLIRFVGNGLHPSDYTRLDDWLERLESWRQLGVHDVYFFPHEPDNVLAPQISAYLAEQVEKHTSFASRGPRLLNDPSGEQMHLF